MVQRTCLSLLALAGLALPATGVSAQTPANGIFIPTEEPAATVNRVYSCPSGPVSVDYLTAGTVALAVLHLADEVVVMANVLSADGARYAGGRYAWWDHGSEASLYDLAAANPDRGETCTPAPVP